MSSQRQKQKNGFTLIELLVIIAIIAILSTIALVFLRGYREKARIADAKTDIRNIFLAVRMLESDTGEWPAHQTPNVVCAGCNNNEVDDFSGDADAGIMQNDPGQPYNNWQGPYLKNMPLDPWDNNYFFDTDYDINSGSGTNWVAAIGSFGPNGGTPNQYDGDDVFMIVAPYIKYP